MKGVVFTEFLEMVESKYGLSTLDQILEESTLKSKGIYTSIGTYDSNEIFQLIDKLSQRISIPIKDLFYIFGAHFFNYLVETYPYIFKLYKTPVDMLQSVEDHIHVQVRKIYSDAELPSITVKEKNSNLIEIKYTSERGLYMFAEALIYMTFDHFDQKCKITTNLLSKDGKNVSFLIELDDK